MSDPAAAPQSGAAKRRGRAATAARKRANEREQEQERWEQASIAFLQRRVAMGWFVFSILIAVIFLVVGIMASTRGKSLSLNEREQTLVIIACWIIALIAFAWGMAGPLMMRARKQLKERERLARERAKEASEEMADAGTLAGLLKANRKQIDAYDELARAQSREAFRNSQIAISIGMTALIVGGLASIVVPSTTAKITTASLTAIAGMLSGYIGKTFLRVYERTQQQLTFFFQQPLINSYVLSAERLIDTHLQSKDQEVSRIIDRILAVLVQLPESWGDWTGKSAGGGGRFTLRGANGSTGAVPQGDLGTGD